MAKGNEATTQITPNYAQGFKNGIYYFKLPEKYFLQAGDETKKCGLLGTDMDSNFHFLEGYDISAVTFNEETKVLELTRVNGEKISTTIEVSLGNPTIEYDSEKGVLNVFYANGTSASTSGFLTKDDISPIYSDETIDGDGTIYNPLRLSELEKTGMFAPVSEYVDIYETGVIPAEYEKGAGYRILTKEKVSDFGYLYDYGAVAHLQELLKDTDWRVPTKEDWNELFDAIASDEEWDGKEGAVLKSVDYWVSGTSYDSLGFRALPTGFDSNYYTDIIENFGETTGFWSYSSAATTEVEVFFLDTGDTKTSFSEPVERHHFAIRLIKNYTTENVSEYENILGAALPTKLINICDNYSKVWTTANFYFADGSVRGISSPEISGSSTVRYFINEWNGSEWEKKRLGEGESVVILEKEGSAPYREWRLENNEIVDTLADLYSKEKSLNDRATSLENRATSAETRISALESHASSAETRIASLEERVASAETIIRTLQSGLTSAATRIETLETEVNTLKVSAMTRFDVIALLNEMFVGTDREIKVTKSDTQIQIGFADDSVFGEMD